jgi:hypothetical protein
MVISIPFLLDPSIDGSVKEGVIPGAILIAKGIYGQFPIKTIPSL